MNWLDRFKKKRPKGPDINRPIAVPPLETPLPDPKRGEMTPLWRLYNQTPKGRRYLQRRRENPTTT